MTAADPLRAEHYEGAAKTALRQAISFREEARSRYVRFDRRIDRALMREFALEYRTYKSRAIRCAHPEATR